MIENKISTHSLLEILSDYLPSYEQCLVMFSDMEANLSKFKKLQSDIRLAESKLNTLNKQQEVLTKAS